MVDVGHEVHIGRGAASTELLGERSRDVADTDVKLQMVAWKCATRLDEPAQLPRARRVDSTSTAKRDVAQYRREQEDGTPMRWQIGKSVQNEIRSE